MNKQRANPWLQCLLLLLLLSGLNGHLMAQSAGREAAPAPQPEQSLFARSLNHQQLDAYSDRALQKVGEWLTYMGLLRDAHQDEVLYGELSAFTKELFLDEGVLLVNEQRQLPLSDWLTANEGYSGPAVFITRHEWVDDWQPVEEGFRRSLMVNLAVLEDDGPGWIGERIMTIYLTRVAKSFGEEMIETWEVRLGEME